MKQFSKQLYMLFLIYVSTTAQAQNFHVLDVNKSKNANPTNNTIFEGYDWGHIDTYYAVYNGISYFSADDGIHGAELWRSDGTSTGTYLIKDINVGSNSSNVRDITISGGKIYFAATDGISQPTIWITDGTSSGTKKIADLNYGSLNPTYLTDVNGDLYFFTDGFYYGYYTLAASQLWKIDGTTNGIQMVAEFYSPEFSYANGGRQITNVNGRVFFSLANYGYDNQLYTSDGTASGTHMVNGINPSGNSNPTYLTALNGLLYFSADVNGTWLWQSDGTDAGTHAVNNNNNIRLDNNTVMRFTIKGNSIYFTGYSSDGNGAELCKYDASNLVNNVEIVRYITPGTFSYNLYNIVNVKGILFFTVFDGTDQVLWKSDGTTAGTSMVKDINPGVHNVYLYKHFENANGVLYFSFYDDIHGYELWKSDGTGDGTTMVKEINPGIYSAAVTNISYLKNNITLFEAYDGKTGLELWSTDGTGSGTKLVKKINQSASASSDPVAIMPAAGNKNLLFIAYDPQYGHELRITDGTESGTNVIKDIYKGSFDSWPYLPVNLKDHTYFFANIDDPVPHYSDDIFLVSRLWKTDGTEKGTSMLSVPALESLINGSGYVVSRVATDNLFYLLIFSYSTNSYELWRSDGTGPGTYVIKTDINYYYYTLLTPIGKTLFFTNFDNTNGYEIWKTDGSPAGTKIVSSPGANPPQNLCAFKNKLYFTLLNAISNNTDLWVSDGSVSGTKILTAVNVASWVPLARTNGKLFFTGNDPATFAGYELWATDGTERGTKIVKDIFPGDFNSSIPSLLTSAGSLIYFTAYENIYGYEIWKSDGTARGTQLVKDITPGIDGSYGVNYLTNSNGQLYFLNNDALWTSDGTPYRTNPVNDRNLAGVSGLGNLTAFEDQLAFTAYAPATGRELYVGDNLTADCNRVMPTELSSLKLNSQLFNPTLYPNPARSKASLEIGSSAGNLSVTLADMNGRTIWQSNYSNQSRIDLPVEKLSAGMYMVTIKLNNDIKTIKLVKE